MIHHSTVGYFGRDARGFYVDVGCERQYVDESVWRAIIEAGAHAGADVTGTDQCNGQRVRLKITEHVCVEKFDGDQLIETVQGSLETTTL